MWDRGLLRAVKWARNPPSMRQVLFFLAILAFCVALFAIENIWGWPEWLTVDRPKRELVLPALASSVIKGSA